MNVITINRTSYQEVQTLGEGYCNGFGFKTLELPWLDNRRSVSCIPIGQYEAFIRFSPRWRREIIEFKNVPGRKNIQIHPGNYFYDIEGCILPGARFIDIDEDGWLDVTSSILTFNKLMGVLDRFKPIRIEVYEQI
jgi:hypothetical protein